MSYFTFFCYTSNAEIGNIVRPVIQPLRGLEYGVIRNLYKKTQVWFGERADLVGDSEYFELLFWYVPEAGCCRN